MTTTVKSPMHESTRRYVSDERVARGYDVFFAGQDLFELDTAVAERWFARPGRLNLREDLAADVRSDEDQVVDVVPGNLVREIGRALLKVQANHEPL